MPPDELKSSEDRGPESRGAHAHILSHIAKFIGPVDFTVRDSQPKFVKVDVQVVLPAPHRPFVTMVTTGMSDLPMQTPDGAGGLRYAELMICLPDGLPNPASEESLWPLKLLRQLARFPFANNTFLAQGHTVPWANPSAPMAAGTKLSSVLILRPTLFAPGVAELQVGEGRQVCLYSLVPIYSEERDFIAKYGREELLDRLHAVGVTELLHPDRPNTCG